MLGRTNKATHRNTSSGGTKRPVTSSREASGHPHATRSSVTATRQAASGSSASTQSKTQAGKSAGSSATTTSSSSTTTTTARATTTTGHRSSGSSGSTTDNHGKKDNDGKPVEEPPEYQMLYVIVFKGATYDSYNKRHCALLIEHRDAANHVWRLNMIDIEGAERMWRVRESVNRDPRFSALFYGEVPIKLFMVGRGVQGRNDRRLRDSIYNARIDNADPEWNCQGWLEGALLRLKAARFLTQEEADAAMSAAYDMVLQAPLPPLAS